MLSNLLRDSSITSENEDHYKQMDVCTSWDIIKESYINSRIEEKYYIPNKDWTINNNIFNINKRASLINHLYQVKSKLKLYPETFEISINLLDRYMTTENNGICEENFYLLGLVCIFIASKYEEVQPVTLKDMLRLTSNNKKEFLSLEITILTKIGYSRLKYSPILYYIRYLDPLNSYNISIRTIAKYFCNLSYLYGLNIKYKASRIASACVIIGYILENGTLDSQILNSLEKLTGYIFDDYFYILYSLIVHITEDSNDEHVNNSIYNDFSTPINLRIAQYTDEKIKKLSDDIFPVSFYKNNENKYLIESNKKLVVFPIQEEQSTPNVEFGKILKIGLSIWNTAYSR